LKTKRNKPSRSEDRLRQKAIRGEKSARRSIRKQVAHPEPGQKVKGAVLKKTSTGFRERKAWSKARPAKGQRPGEERSTERVSMRSAMSKETNT